MTTSLYDASEQQAKREVERLKSITLSVPTDEDIARIRAEDDSRPIHIALEVVTEPLSYRIEGGRYGNENHDFIRITKGLGLGGVEGVDETELLIRVRELGWNAIPTSIMVKIPKGTKSPEQCTYQFQRWMLNARKAKVGIEIDESTGEVSTASAGTAFEMLSGSDSFPLWLRQDNDEGIEVKGFGRWSKPARGEPATDRFMRYFDVAATDYVIPENVPVQVREVPTEGVAASAVASPTGVATVDPAMLKTAAEVLGLDGTKFADLSKSNMLAKTVQATREAPILGTAEVQQAVRDKKFGEYLVDHGVISDVDGKVVLA